MLFRTGWPGTVRWLERGSLAKSARVVFGFVWCWNLIWIALEGSLVFSPPVDTVEQLVWVRALAWGYEKHPPLPTALLWPIAQTLGLRPFAAYLLSATLVAIALTMMWRLVKEIGGTAIAWIALLGTMCSGYYSTHLIYYDHDTVLMLSFVLSGWFCWRALRDRSLLAWAGVGIALGLGALTKYQVAITVITVLACWLHQRGWRDPVHRRGLLIAAGIALLIFAPHLQWLFEHDFAPFHYAEQSTLGSHFGPGKRIAHALTFGYQQARQLLAAAAAAAVLLWLTRPRTAVSRPDPGITRAVPDPDARWFLFCWGVLPLIAMIVIGLGFGIRLQYHWGSIFMPFTCVWAMRSVATARWQAIAPARLAGAFVIVQALSMGAAWVGAPGGMGRGYGTFIQAFYPAQRLADALAPGARAALCGPIRVIAGPWFEASAIALALREKPLVLIDGDIRRSPWVAASELDSGGVLWIGHPTVPMPNEPAKQWRHPLDNQYWWAVTPRHTDCVPGDPL